METCNAETFVEHCEAVLSAGGPVAKCIDNFRSRKQQIKMTRYVSESIAHKKTLVVEAGTGVGKTFAYLVPALLSGKKIVISTGTRYLQDQIYHKDLPAVLQALQLHHTAALLKGRANYLCLERLDWQWRNPDLEKKYRDQVTRIYDWSQVTKDGDINGFQSLAESDPIWQSFTSTVENCLGSKCPHYDGCFVAKARKRALKADIVIVNHYLLLADMTLKDTGFGQLLPSIDTVIVDEAHQLDEVADYFFCESIGSRQIESLLIDLEHIKEYRQAPALKRSTETLRMTAQKLLSAMADSPSRANVQTLEASNAITSTKNALYDALKELVEQLKVHNERSEVLNNCDMRALKLMDNLKEVFTNNNDTISWYQREKQSFRFYISRVDISPLLKEKYALYDANWIYTSATLAVNGSFNCICRKLGVSENEDCIQLDNPFDFSKQAALYLPQDLPDPNDPDHTERFIEASYDLLDMANGHALYLFTSHRALRSAAKKLRAEKDFILFIQGDMPKLKLVESFCTQPGSLLLGTASFWEGMDVRGAGLHCVMIDRLPFGKPDDPLMQGRHRVVQERGGNFFTETILPTAVVSLRQGVGRLIRDESDKGVVMLGDIRLRTKSYGKVFLRSLPPMKCYTDIVSLRPYLQ